MEYDIEIPGNIPTSAKGSSYGYLYQMMRALYWLSLTPPGSIVALETDDDIVIKLQNGANLEHIFEQDKASLDKKYPYSNKNINLWKTLSNWLNLVYQKNIPIETSRFILVTNVSTKSTNIIKQLNNKVDRDENFFLNIYNDLKRIAEIEISKYSEPETDIKKQTLPYYAYNFLQYDASIVISLLKRIELCDLNQQEEKLKEETIRNLRLNIEGLPSYDLYNSLYGWFIGLCCQLWISGSDAILNEKRLWEARDFWVKKFEQKPFIEKAAHLIPIPINEQDQEKNSLYIKQLELISLEEKEKLNAILDFLRAKKEKARYAVKGNITNDHFIAYEDILKQNWDDSSAYNKRLSKNLSSEDLGFKIYMDTIKFKGILAGIEPEFHYLSRGTYHKMAGAKILGWHPDWEKLLNTTDNE